MRHAGTLISIILLALLLLSGIGEAQSPSTEETLSPAQRSLGQCLTRNGRLAALFLIDESGSLKRTDPRGARVDGVAAALAGFARIADAPINGRRPQVSVSFVGFSGKLDPDPDADPDGGAPVPTWQSLNGANLQQVLKAADRFRLRDDRRDTDYALALSGARTLLAREAARLTEDGGRPPCRALIWFTDGKYEVLDRVGAADGLPKSEPYAPGVDIGRRGGGAEAVKAGRAFMCGRGGLMDGLVGDEVIKFTVALTSAVDPADDAFLRAVTQGGDCGSTLSPDTGDYLDVKRADCLFFTFGDLLAGRGCPDGGVVCPRRSCSPGQRGLNSFRTVQGLSRMLIRATTGGDGVELTLRGPDGRAVRLRPRDNRPVTVSGARIIPRWVSSQAVEVEGVFDATTAWIGAWSYSFVDREGRHPDAVPISRVQLLADLRPRLAGPPIARKGSSVTVPVVLARADGTPVRSGPLVEKAAVTATVTDPVKKETGAAPVQARDAAGQFPVTVALDEDVDAPYVFLDVDTRFDVAEDVTIQPSRSSFQLKVSPPLSAGFPTVTPDELRPGSVRGRGETSAVLRFQASRVAAGCAWISPGEFRTAPVIDAPARCLRLRRGETREVRVTFSADGEDVGTERRQLDVHLQSGRTGKTTDVRIEASYETLPESNVPLRVAIFALVLGIGILIPVAILYALNWYGARFTPPQSVLGLTFPVVVRPGRDVRNPDGEERIPVGYDEFDPLSPSGRDRPERSIDIPLSDGSGTIRLRTVPVRTPKDLFDGPSGVAGVGGPPLIVRSLHATGSKEGTRPEISLSLPDTWIFVPASVREERDDEGQVRTEEVQGSLTLLIASGAPIERGAEVYADARAELLTRDWTGATEYFDALAEEEDEPGLVTGLIDRMRPGHTAPAPAFDEADDLGDEWGGQSYEEGSDVELPPSDADASEDRSGPSGGADF